MTIGTGVAEKLSSPFWDELQHLPSAPPAPPAPSAGMLPAYFFACFYISISDFELQPPPS